MRADCTRPITAAARWPARRLPANRLRILGPGSDARVKNAQTRGVSCKSTIPPSKGARLFAGLVRQRRPNHQHLAVHFALAATAACCRRSEKLCPRMALCKNSAKYCRGKHFWSFSGGTDESCKFSQSGGECVAKERTLHRRRPCRAFFASAGALAAAGHKGLQICLQGCFRLDSYQLGKLGRGNILGALCTRLHTAGAASPPALCSVCSNCPSFGNCASSPLGCAKFRAFLQSRHHRPGTRHFPRLVSRQLHQERCNAGARMGLPCGIARTDSPPAAKCTGATGFCRRSTIWAASSARRFGLKCTRKG